LGEFDWLDFSKADKNNLNIMKILEGAEAELC
jgi:hypothetical protein